MVCAHSNDMTDTISTNTDSQPGLRVVIADDHALVRGGLALLIDMTVPGAEVLQAGSLEQVTEILTQKTPVSLLLLDLLMPGMQGEAGVRSIADSWPDIPVVIVSMKEDTDTIRRLLAAGAMGYIPKTSTPDVTISAIRLVLDGGIYIPPHVLHLNENPSSPSPDPDDYRLPANQGNLTRRQLQVLELIKSGKSNNAIANELGLTTGTVKMHVSGIFKKLNVTNRTEAVAIWSTING